jgi:hypothetical protein
MTEHAYKDRSFSFRLRQILSYFRPVPIEKRKGSQCPSLEVMLENGYMVLNAGGSNYSHGSVHTLCARAFGKYDPVKRKIKNALILGFGAGSIAELLLEDYELDIPITGVEYDEEVIALYEKYFEDDPGGNIELIHANAFDFVKASEKSFHFIAVNLFTGSEAIAPQATTSFLHQTCALLSPGGILFYNCIADTPENKARKEEIIAVLKGIQGRTSEIQLPLNGMSNVMLVFER